MNGSDAVACPRCGARVAGRLRICPRCALEAELPPARLGESLDLLEEIGHGGMGTVWKARHRHLGRLVAVKFLSAALAKEPEFERRFRREAQALGRLSHPGIVAVYDYGSDDGEAYIVMELVDGTPLSALLPLSPARAREIGLEILDALGYAHERGVVHRDVKPQNILVERGGRVKVTDFGIARLLDAEPAAATLTAAGRIIGTPAYMAPEALAGAAPDPRMDVYSLGILLYEALAGERPVAALAAAPEALRPVLARALAADPEERYPTAAAMRADLARVDPTGRAGALPADERQWLHATALVQTLATAAVLWALLLSVTPRVLSAADVQPLIMIGADTLPNGRVVSRARFETWPTLAAIGSVVLALVAQGLLRRHWRQAGLDVPRPERAVPASRGVLACGIVAVSVYGLRVLAAPPASFWTSYVPILGGLLELATLFVAWTAVLEARRISRPLFRELALWTGAALALVPPTVDLARYLRAWHP